MNPLNNYNIYIYIYNIKCPINLSKNIHPYKLFIIPCYLTQLYALTNILINTTNKNNVKNQLMNGFYTFFYSTTN